MKGIGSGILLFILLIIPAIADQSKDWQLEVDRFLGSVPNPEGLITFLEPIYYKSSADDRPLMSLIMAFAASRLENHSLEARWLKIYFEEQNESVLQINCFRDSINIDLMEYMTKWRRQYPRINSIFIQPDRYPFMEKPSKLPLTIDLPVNCSYGLRVDDMMIEEGRLSPGPNQILLPPLDYGATHPLPPLTIELESGGVTIRKQIIIALKYEKPEEVEIHNQMITLKGRTFRNTNKIILKTDKKRNFDKKRFFKRFLPFLGAGLAVFIINRLAIHPGSHSWNRSAEGCMTAVSIGFTLKSLEYLIGSFPANAEKNPVSVVDQEAVLYNEQLKQAIEEVKKNVFAVFSLQIKESGS